MSSKTQGVNALRWINSLYQADLLTSDKHAEYVQLIRKGFSDAAYYYIIKQKMTAQFNDATRASLSQPQINLVEQCLNHLSDNWT